MGGMTGRSEVEGREGGNGSGRGLGVRRERNSAEDKGGFGKAEGEKR